MKIEITINNIRITEDIDDNTTDAEIKNKVSRITLAILSAKKELNPEVLTISNNPINIPAGLGVKTVPNSQYNTNMNLVSDKPASEKQIKLLKKLGYTGTIEGLSCRQVAEIIEQINKRNGYDYDAFRAGKEAR